MKKSFFNTEVEEAIHVLKNGGIILYPTDTIWGIGCNAANEEAINKIYDIKQREDSKNVIILVADEKEILQYVAATDLHVFDFIEKQTKPTTIIFDNAIGLPQKLIADDGSIAIRIVKDEFCRHLIKRLRSPIVSTSANISGKTSPKNFINIEEEIKNAVDHVVKWRQNDEKIAQPSQIIKWKTNGDHEIIRP